MYYVAFARYDYYREDGVDSGRMSYITDDLIDATQHYDSWCYWDEDLVVRRGGVFGPFESFDDPELQRYIRASDEISGRTGELEAHGWNERESAYSSRRTRRGSSAATEPAC